MLGVVISTYNRVDDARINMEIIRSLWSSYFDVKIIHAFNGEHAWWPRKYLEDDLVFRSNRGHFQGAVDLMELGLCKLHNDYTEIDYVVHLSSDTWCISPSYVRDVMHRMQCDRKPFASCVWGSKNQTSPWSVGLAIDFCVLDQHWAHRQGFVPIDYEGFVSKHGDLLGYLGQNVFPERVLALRFLQAVRRADPTISENGQWEAGNQKLCRLIEREPVHDATGRRLMVFERSGLWTHHGAEAKRQLLVERGLNNLGPYTKKLVMSDDLSYFNNGIDC